MSEQVALRDFSYVVRVSSLSCRNQQSPPFHAGPDLLSAVRYVQGLKRDELVSKLVKINRICAQVETDLIALQMDAKTPAFGREVLVAPVRPADARIPGGPIVGFRCWRLKIDSHLTGEITLVDGREIPEVTIDRVELLAMHADAVWKDAQVRFQCADDSAPHVWHHCGVHAFHTLSEASRESRKGSTSQYPVVLGVVSGHGDVMVHGRGWRAEEAHVLAIAENEDFPEACRQLAGRWDIPLISQQELEAFAAGKGRTISKERAALEGSS